MQLFLKMTKWTSHLCKMTQNDINLQTLCARLLRACCQGKILWILVLCRCAFYGCRRLLQHISPCRARGSPAHKKQIQVTYKHRNCCKWVQESAWRFRVRVRYLKSACVCCRCEYFMVFHDILASKLKPFNIILKKKTACSKRSFVR